MIFCGDRHWQYHSIHPLGFEEFSCGALNDENAINGVKSGSPDSTDPQGLIIQRFLYPKPTGGFLHITLRGGSQATLKIAFCDDLGAVAYALEKSYQAR